MKGLLIKDFRIIAKNKKLFDILLFLVVFMFLMNGEGVESFIISYVTLLGGSLVLTTISTDEFDKSTTFLMTLPIKPRTYALEKYVFSFGCSISCWLVSTIACCMITGSGVVELVKAALVLLLVMSLFQLIMIPVQLKFGGENGRMVLMGIIVAVFAVGFLMKKVSVMAVGSEETVQLWIQGMVRFFDSLSYVPVMLGVIIVFVIGIVISIRISTRVMEKREY